MKKLLLLIILSVSATTAFTQRFNTSKIQAITQEAVKKAYPASIRMWAYDTVKKEQAGPQFSAVVVSHDGYILTAAHVNTPGQTYMVTFPDKKTAIAKGLGEIELAETPMLPDVAMMKIISKGPWPYAEIGRSSGLKINELVVSISYPESLNQPLPLVRFGSVTNLINEYGFLQSTSRMEPGDSGGPLFDYLGRVIGLHSAINGDIDYEVPVDLYRKYWTALQLPKTYTALPSQSDVVATDSLKVLGIPALSDLNAKFLKAAKRYIQNAVTIISTSSGKPTQITGTLIKVNGGTYLISKSSMVGKEPLGKLANGKEIPLKVVYRDQNTDLVLLQPASQIKGGITIKSFTPNDERTEHLGKFLVSIQPDINDLEVSVLGSGQFSQPKIAGMAYLGAAVAYQEPVAITVVQPGSPAGDADLKIGDRLVRINGFEIGRPEDYGKQLMKYWAGDTIKFEVLRQDTAINKQIVLASRPERPATHPADLFEGGKSSRRDGFDKVFAHGADIKPVECGGPVFDLQGTFLGINIARFSRTTTLAIPANSVLSFLKMALDTTQSP